MLCHRIVRICTRTIPSIRVKPLFSSASFKFFSDDALSGKNQYQSTRPDQSEHLAKGSFEIKHPSRGTPADEPLQTADRVSSTVGNTEVDRIRREKEKTPANARKLSSNDGDHSESSKNSTKDSKMRNEPSATSNDTEGAKIGKPSAGVNSMYKASDYEQTTQQAPSKRPSSGQAKAFHSSARVCVRGNPGTPGMRVPENQTDTPKAENKVSQAWKEATEGIESAHPSAEWDADPQRIFGTQSEKNVAADRSPIDPRKRGDHHRQG